MHWTSYFSAVVWPDNARKAVIKDWYKREHGFAECIGAVDGVPFPLAVGPSWETNAWITRKCDYAMGATAVCDHLGRFIYFATGYVGSTHDALAYKRTQLYTQPDNYFDGQEYILADAAYALTSTVIPRYRNAVGDRAQFNTLHGAARVKVEHGFGMLKMKFKSLQKLPILIKSADVDKTTKWICACVVLHNFVREDATQEIVEDDVIQAVRQAAADRENEDLRQNWEGDIEAEHEDRDAARRKRDGLKAFVLRNKNKTN